jgi:hypothetical protein
LNKNTLDISDSNLYSIYNELDDSYNIGVNLFYNCVSLQTIKLPVNKVVLRFKCLCNCSPQLKIVGPEIIDVYDEFFTLLSFVPVSLETEVQKYLMKLYRAYKSNNDESEFWTFIQNVYLHLYDEDMKVYYSHGNLCYTTYDDEEAIISNDNVLAMVEQYYADELEVILFNIYTDFDVVAVDGCCLPQFHGTLVGKKNEKLCSITELLEMVTESIYRGGYKKYEKIHDRITSCELHEHITYRL